MREVSDNPLEEWITRGGFGSLNHRFLSLPGSRTHSLDFEGRVRLGEVPGAPEVFRVAFTSFVRGGGIETLFYGRESEPGSGLFFETFTYPDMAPGTHHKDLLRAHAFHEGRVIERLRVDGEEIEGIYRHPFLGPFSFQSPPKYPEVPRPSLWERL